MTELRGLNSRTLGADTDQFAWMREHEVASWYVPSAEAAGTFQGYDRSTPEGAAVLGYFDRRLTEIAGVASPSTKET